MMDKVLNQEEIDAMVRAARSGGAAAEASVHPKVHVERWDVRRAGQIGREQLQAITLLHEGFARSLTNSLGAYLRVVFAATLVSAEHLTYREYLQRLPETTYLASCRLDPTGTSAALQLDLKVAFPIIDLLLGGEGKGLAETRDITTIEEQILDSVTRIICRELGVAWQALSLAVNFEERLNAGEAQRLMPPEEKILSLSFEVTMPDIRGGLNLAVPATVSNALLRKISSDWSHRRSPGATDLRQRLMRRILECRFELELAAVDLKVPVGSLAKLASGQVLSLAHAVSEPASLLIAGIESFRAVPARTVSRRAAKLLALVSSAKEGTSEGKGKSQ